MYFSKTNVSCGSSFALGSGDWDGVCTLHGDGDGIPVIVYVLYRLHKHPRDLVDAEDAKRTYLNVDDHLKISLKKALCKQ